MITDQEKRLMEAAQSALKAGQTETSVDVGDLLDVLQALHASRLTWTTQKPTAPGRYWWRDSSRLLHVVEIFHLGQATSVFYQGQLVAGGPIPQNPVVRVDAVPAIEWAGPIPEPKE